MSAWRRWGALACVLSGAVLMLCQSRASIQVSPAIERFEKINLRKHQLTRSELKGLSEVELKQLRGIIFGKHGRVFGEKLIEDYLQTRPWYKVSRKYQVTDLNNTERRNMDAIKEAEWRLHKFIEPGDLKFYRKHAITVAELGTHTPLEWRIMRAEIEAIHGKRFGGEPYLQKFFDERYWYHPRPRYKPTELNRIERKNLATLITAEKKQRAIAVLPGELARFRNRQISEDSLRGLTLHELRLLRNEVYAEHYFAFGIPWMDEYFYGPALGEETDESDAPPPTKSELTYADHRNVAAILRSERRLHDQLFERPLTESDLIGLFAEDAEMLRLELYARRGKEYKGWLGAYFQGQSWYQPDHEFNESSLSETDRKNIAFLKAYEKTAERAAERVAA